MSIIGCDIGNGFGYVSLLSDPEADPVALFPKQAKNLDKDLGMPTTAYVAPPSGETIEVYNGNTAEELHKRDPEHLVRAIKSRMDENTIALRDIALPIEVSRIYSAIVRDMMLLAHRELSSRAIPPIYDIVFTFPASMANETAMLEKMEKSIESIEINGTHIKVRGRLPEPAAAAIDYLHYMQHLAPPEHRIDRDSFTVLVYDLGYGTFDTAVVTAQTKDEPYILHSIGGLKNLGGRDFDELLRQEILSQISQKHGVEIDNYLKNAVDNVVVETKLALTDDDSYILSIPCRGDYLEVEITRTRFEQLSEHLILQTLELVQDVLETAEQKGIQIDSIVLSGGASQMPMVKRALDELADGKYPVVLYRPGTAVSFGAARFARGIADPEPKPINREQNDYHVENYKPELPAPNPVLEQLTDCCYGLWVPSEQSPEGEILFVVPCGSKRPTKSKPVSFFCSSSRIRIKVYHSKEKNKKLSSAPVDECSSILWFPFDVTPGAHCKVTITATENYGIEVELSSDKDGISRKSTAYKTSDLL